MIFMMDMLAFLNNLKELFASRVSSGRKSDTHVRVEDTPHDFESKRDKKIDTPCCVTLFRLTKTSRESVMQWQ